MVNLREYFFISTIFQVPQGSYSFWKILSSINNLNLKSRLCECFVDQKRTACPFQSCQLLKTQWWKWLQNSSYSYVRKHRAWTILIDTHSNKRNTLLIFMPHYNDLFSHLQPFLYLTVSYNYIVNLRIFQPLFPPLASLPSFKVFSFHFHVFSLFGCGLWV